MSNDISASRLPPAAAPLPPSATVQAEKPQRAPVLEIPKPAAQVKHDPQEARRNMQEASEQLNKQMAQKGRDLSFSVDDVANKIVLTVKNSQGEVVRQIPSEVALRVAHSLDEVKGLLQDEKS